MDRTPCKKLWILIVLLAELTPSAAAWALPVAPAEPFSFTRALHSRAFPFDGDRPISAGQDYNGDGVLELAIGQSTFSYAEVAILDGVTGSILRQFRGRDDADSNFIESLAIVPDMNGDGFRDVIVGDPLVGRGRVYNFSTIGSGPIEEVGRLIYEIEGPGPTAGFGNDVAVFDDKAAIAWSDRGRVRIVDLATGAAVAQLSGRSTSGFGFSVTPIGDVNNDGAEDWLASDPNVFPGGSGRGEAYVLSGLTTTPTDSWTPIDSLPAGSLLATLRNEGAANVFMGVSRNSPFANLGDPSPGNGQIEQFLVSGGADGFLAHKLTLLPGGNLSVEQVAFADPQTSEFGQLRHLEGLSDVNFDGVGDFALLDDLINAVVIISGRDLLDGYQPFDILQRMVPAAGEQFSALTSLGDYDANGSVDLAIGMRVAGTIRYDVYSAAVPEPSSTVLAAVALVAIIVVSRSVHSA